MLNELHDSRLFTPVTFQRKHKISPATKHQTYILELIEQKLWILYSFSNSVTRRFHISAPVPVLGHVVPTAIL
jgi:hypothetical protein